jgi:membrane fusion protein, multidrug efflux system
MKRIGVYIYFSVLFFACNSKPDDADTVGSPRGKSQKAQVEGFVIKGQSLPNEVRTSGTIVAFEEVELHPEATGRIQKIFFKEGSSVTKGQLLVKINDDDLQAQLKKARSGIRLSRQQLSRQDELLKINATSRQEHDIASNQLNSLLADEEVLMAAIAKTEIRAPFKGMAGLRYVSEGSYVTPATRIATLQNIDPVKVDFSIPERYANAVERNDEVSFSMEESGISFTGKVYAVEPKIDEATRTLKVRALCANSDGKIVPGSFVKVRLRLNEIKDALMVPSQSLMPVLKGQNIYIVKNGMAKAVPVKTGIRTEREVQVTEGLQPGDTVLTKGIISLKPDVPVQVKVIP